MIEHNETAHAVRIQIDREKYESPRVTTHQALYELGKVEAGWQLFLEPADRHHEDKPIHKDGSSIHLVEDQHFYSREVK